MGHPEYQARRQSKHYERKLRDATLVVDAFEMFMKALIDDKVLNDLESHIALNASRSELIAFLCQQSKG